MGKRILRRDRSCLQVLILIILMVSQLSFLLMLYRVHLSISLTGVGAQLLAFGMIQMEAKGQSDLILVPIILVGLQSYFRMLVVQMIGWLTTHMEIQSVV